MSKLKSLWKSIKGILKILIILAEFMLLGYSFYDGLSISAITIYNLISTNDIKYNFIFIVRKGKYINVLINRINSTNLIQ